MTERRNGRSVCRRAITWLSRIKSHLIPFHASRRRWSFERRKLPRDPFSPPSFLESEFSCASAFRPTLSEKQITRCFSARQRVDAWTGREGDDDEINLYSRDALSDFRWSFCENRRVSRSLNPRGGGHHHSGFREGHEHHSLRVGHVIQCQENSFGARKK